MLDKQNIIGTERLDHFGLIAAVIKDSNLIEYIDEKIPVRKISKLTIGQRAAALIQNGLGFIDQRLYIFPSFLKNKAVIELFGKDIVAEDFNEHSLGRALDKIHEYGETQLFSEVATKIALDYKLFGKSINIDSTTLSLFGEYNNAEDVEYVDKSKVNENPIPKFGYAKNKRTDLKQMVLLLAKMGPANLPIHMESHNGSESDKIILKKASERIKEFCAKLSELDKDLFFIADSAMYEKCVKEGTNISWLSRVPATIGKCKKLLNSQEIVWKSLDEKHKIYEVKEGESDKNIRWVMIFSKEAYNRELKSLHKEILEESNRLQKAKKSFESEIFGCEKDLKTSFTEFEKKFKYHELTYSVTNIKEYKTKGRPKKDTEPEKILYKVAIYEKKDEITIKNLENCLGRFILASNELSEKKLKSIDFLNEYKSQSGVESGFKFIKDDSFQVDSVFLKKPGRIAALMCIMTLCLLMYNLLQYIIRTRMKEQQQTIPAQKKNKVTSSPSLKWVFKIFEGIDVLKIKVSQVIHRIILNIDDVRRKIIQLLGDTAIQIYEL